MKVKSIIFVLIVMILFLASCKKSFVKLTDKNSFYAGLDDHFKIETSNATYFFRKSGGGFSGIIDSEGNDWIGHSSATKSEGKWRGLPNTNIIGWRPEQSGTETKIISQAKDKLVILCEKNNNKCTWTFYHDHATMTVIKADNNYYFSYEGAPYGKFETTTNYLFRPDIGKRHFLGQPTEQTDIKAMPSESWEWCYFGDTKTNRALFFIHHEDDVIPDFYRPLGQMTVFGFGRTENASENIKDVPQNFTIGFSADTTCQVIADKVRRIVIK